ncbi:MAG TPA: molybdenum cofactor guanylyltransferase, partial [Solirubrobacterales bacterium]|nr:molybdenum cofactor guanylyltransferase [Solirubrobacterales bacterium]
MPALGAVLAGGRGSRLGGDKAAALLAGRPLAVHVAAAFAEAGLDAVLCAKPGEAVPGLELSLVAEPPQPRHPLAGIVAALRAGEGRPVVAVACDMPFVAPSLLAALAAAPEPLVVPAPRGRLQPLCARYAPTTLPALEAALGAEEPLTRTVASLDPVVWDEEVL